LTDATFGAAFPDEQALPNNAATTIAETLNRRSRMTSLLAL
jgi:hypothetical protein